MPKTGSWGYRLMVTSVNLQLPWRLFSLLGKNSPRRGQRQSPEGFWGTWTICKTFQSSLGDQRNASPTRRPLCGTVIYFKGRTDISYKGIKNYLPHGKEHGKFFTPTVLQHANECYSSHQACPSSEHFQPTPMYPLYPAITCFHQLFHILFMYVSWTFHIFHILYQL